MIDTETVTTTILTCDICDQVVNEFDDFSLVSDKNRVIKDRLDDELYPNNSYKVSLVFFSKDNSVKETDIMGSLWYQGGSLDVCISCCASIKKHLVGLAKKE